MKVYEVDAADGEMPLVFATKGEALKAAKAFAVDFCPPGEAVQVSELTLCPFNKATIVRALNSAGGYVAERVVIAKFPSRQEQP